MTAANKTWLRSNEPQMHFVAASLWLSQSEGAFVDFAGGGDLALLGQSVEPLRRAAGHRG